MMWKKAQIDRTTVYDSWKAPRGSSCPDLSRAILTFPEDSDRDRDGSTAIRQYGYNSSTWFHEWP
jgi:hypothetical protein